MKTTLEKLPKSKVKLTVEVPQEMIRIYFTRVYNKMAPLAEVKGFRPGKAPRHLTISAIGENKLTSEILNMALSETYGEAIKKEDILPIASPKINIKKIADLTTDNAQLEYEAEIDVLPEAKIGDYKKLRIVNPQIYTKNEELRIKVTKDEIDQILSHLRRQHATFKEVDRPAKLGDRIEMDFEGSERGVVLENLTSKNYPVILGSKSLIPEFEKKLVGMKKSGEKEFDVELGPAKSDDSGAGKKLVHFKVKMHQVQEVILPALDDELAKKFQQKNLDNLKKTIEADIIKQKEITKKQKQEQELVEELLKISEVEVPESLIEQEVNRMIEQLKSRAQTAGIPFEKYLENLKKTEDEFKKDLAPQAEKTVKIGLIIGEIAKKEEKTWKIDLKEQDAGKKVMEKLLDLALTNGKM